VILKFSSSTVSSKNDYMYIICKVQIEITCTMHTRVPMQLKHSLRWTPVWCAAYSYQWSIHRDRRVGLCNLIQFVARDWHIPVITVWSHCGYTGYTIIASPLYSPLALESQLESLLDGPLGSLHERAMLDKATLQEYRFPLEAVPQMKTLTLQKLWPIEGCMSVKALTQMLM